MMKFSFVLSKTFSLYNEVIVWFLLLCLFIDLYICRTVPETKPTWSIHTIFVFHFEYILPLLYWHFMHLHSPGESVYNFILLISSFGPPSKIQIKCWNFCKHSPNLVSIVPSSYKISHGYFQTWCLSDLGPWYCWASVFWY